MKVIKATNATIDALRKCSMITRSYTKASAERKNGNFITSDSKYRGPFMVSWYSDDIIEISSPEGFTGSTGYAGSICTGDMMVVHHVRSGSVEWGGAGSNSLIVLKAKWGSGAKFNTSFHLVPDPWSSCLESDRTIAADYLNPVTEEYPYRNPQIALYPIARITDSGDICQLQYGHIIDYGRWWRLTP